MARISGPSDFLVPKLTMRDVDVFLPVDLPEGGQLHLVVGNNALVPAQVKLDLPRGCMVAVLAPDVVDKHFPRLQTADEIKGFPAVLLPDMTLAGALPLSKPIWMPEGGFLNVRVGLNPEAQPVPSVPIVDRSILAVVGPEQAEQIRTALKELTTGQNPYAVVPNGNPS